MAPVSIYCCIFPFQLPPVPSSNSDLSFPFPCLAESGFSREDQQCIDICVYIYICIYIYKEIGYKELAHGITEAEKSQEWRPRRASGGFYPKSKNLRTKNADSLISVWEQVKTSGSPCGELEVVKQREQISLSLPCCSLQALSRLIKCPPKLGRAISFSEFTRSNVNLTSQIYLEIMLNQISGQPNVLWPSQVDPEN